jgi:poly-gamma-glutamate capsule biosynthesis protein CapA/YwtB (metallophosphatase superfamily)
MLVALAGDTMLGRVVNEALLRHGPAYPWGDVLPELHRADARIVNLECVIARHGTPWQRWPKAFHFRANPLAIDALKLAGIDCVVIANNHVLDYEEEAFLEMLGLLEAAGIPYVGAGRNLEEARRPVILQLQGLRLGVVAFTDNEPGWKATPTTPGTNYLPVSLESVPLLQEGMAQARAMGADLLIVSAHWGPNMRLRPTPAFREFARALIEAGADVFHGHSAHVFQGIEVWRGRPILYDCGEFVDDYAVDPLLRNDWGLLFGLEVDGRGVRRVELTPLRIDDCQVNRAVGEDFEAIAHRIRELSAEMGTALQREGSRLWVACA